MPVLATGNFDDVLIKNEPASVETPFSPLCLWETFRSSRAANSGQWSGLAEMGIRWRDNKKRSDKKQPRKGRDIVFPIISQRGFLLL